MKKSLYATLGMDPKASEGDIRAAYERRLAETRPDDAITRLALKEAWHVLGNAQRRAVYDASLHDQARKQQPSVRSPVHAEGKGKMWWAIGLAMLIAIGWMMSRHGRASAPKVDHTSQLAVQLDPPAQADVPSPIIPTPPPAQAPTMPPPTGVALTPEQLFAQASPSIVRINVVNDRGVEMGHGSGVVIGQGEAITNCHVAKAGPRLRVRHQGKQYDASILINDERHDLCKLSVIGLDAPPVPIGRVASVHVGQKVYAIGSPQGLDLTLSDGMVSSLRDSEEGTYIQTTAPISPGSSGGGLFDEQGVLIGIVTFQMRTGQNLNFALPADWIERMQTSAPVARHDPRGRSAPPSPYIVGTWHCFGPLTGRGMDVTLDEQGNARGTYDGQPIGGRYALNNRLLNLMGNSFLVEELSASRMVLSKGEGRRLACTH
ncbi:MAG: trypsin-like peptidase domain-containing protein [Aquabacterium sp.]|uniref:trypsin-like peptidase domain-containing protein n=1 Tax=Aquabacterium sp. TaxID=1872578 RepID=UPI0025BD5721|nr:trypsin-like peptidase domain-containing protein [Aquabacterium sp.]MBI5927578.1 trypsin-like peptidase domain-containing protein [Aquabacterium sp.]